MKSTGICSRLLAGLPHWLLRCRYDFCSLYLIIEHQLVLMVYGFEYALNTNAVPVA